MAACEIVKVNRLSGDHFVYNLSTSDHWFTGNGIAVHNCRCSVLYVEPGEETDMSNRGFRGDAPEVAEVARRKRRSVIRARDL